MNNLFPKHIIRQRMVIEGRRDGWVTEEMVAPFFDRLSHRMGMHIIDMSITLAPEAGWAGIVHWDFSHAAFMAWDEKDQNGKHIGLFSVDLNSCKPYSYMGAAHVTSMYWHSTSLVWWPVLHELSGLPESEIMRPGGGWNLLNKTSSTKGDNSGVCKPHRR